MNAALAGLLKGLGKFERPRREKPPNNITGKRG